MEIYCALLEGLQKRRDSLETQGKSEEIALGNDDAVIISYAFEIGMKFLWALENSPGSMPHKHNLITLFDDLKAETKESPEHLELTRDDLVTCPEPLSSNRYSMEEGNKIVIVSQPQLLRSLSKLVEERLEETRTELMRPLKQFIPCMSFPSPNNKCR